MDLVKTPVLGDPAARLTPRGGERRDRRTDADAAVARHLGDPLTLIEITDAGVSRPNLLVSLSDDELSPAGLAARSVLEQVARRLVTSGQWPGATLHKS